MIKGFTLIELLVVMAITILVGTLMVPKFLQFKDFQDLQDAASKMQTAIKLTQANAFSSYNCGDSFNPAQKTTDWRINVSQTSYKVLPNCPDGNNTPAVTTDLPAGLLVCNVVYDDGGVVSLPSNCDTSVNAVTSFDNLTGKVGFIGVVNRNRMVIVLSSKATNTKFGVFVEHGGLIYTGAVQ